MKIDILTLFPEMFKGPFDTSMLKKAQDDGLAEIYIHNLRNWAIDKHKTVDDRPYGGGAGMILKVDVIDRALQDLKSEANIPQKVRSPQLAKLKRDDKAGLNSLPASSKSKKSEYVVLMSAKGKLFNQEIAYVYSKLDHIILIAGHYEGVDERVAEYLVDEEISIGNYVLTGGEIPAMVVTDTVVRLIPGVLNPESLNEESFSQLEISNSKLEIPKEYPHYTRPEKYRGWRVPEILLSGNHKQIKLWRNEAPTSSRSGYLLPAHRREQNPTEAENTSHSSSILRSKFSAKGDKTALDKNNNG